MLIPLSVSFVGLALIICNFIHIAVVFKKYEKVKAVCIRIDSKVLHDSDGDRTEHWPVWEYYYDCQKYTSDTESSTSLFVSPVGTEKIIYVNPHNPLEIYNISLSGIIIDTVAGLLIFIVGIIYTMFCM